MQAAVAVLSSFGIIVTPEHSNEILAGAVAGLGVLGAIKGYFSKDKDDEK